MTRGQTLIELLIAIGVFMVVIAGFSFLVLDSYASGRLAQEITMADFLAQEGVEAARSIRDNSWDSLITGNHGIAISGNNWVFQGAGEDISSVLASGSRRVTIEDLVPPDPDRRKVTSLVLWQFTPDRAQETRLVTYLTNWQKVNGEIKRPRSFADNGGRTTNEANAYDGTSSAPNDTFADTLTGYNNAPSITYYNWATTSYAYTSLILRVNRSAAGNVNDQWRIRYSTNGGGRWNDLEGYNSNNGPRGTVELTLLPTQNLSQLRVRIDTKRQGSSDGGHFYAYDIWTEGAY